MDWGSIIGGIGIGSIAASLLTQYLSSRETQRERGFKTKEKTYLGLLEALYLSEIIPSTENAKNYGLWNNKVLLVGSPDVVRFSQKIIDTVGGSIERREALDDLFQAMREDLNVDSRKIN